MKSNEHREFLFKKYSSNWSIIRPLYNFGSLNEKLNSEYKVGVMCPLCMRVHDRSSLNQNTENPLTLEHCPPEELGGKPKLLLCKKCNSTTGHALDIKLMEYLNVKPFNLGEAESSVVLQNTKLKSGELDVNGTAEFTRVNSNSFAIDLKLGTKEKYRKERLNRILESDSFQIEYKPHTTPESSVVNAALLKIAYLLAFHKFGHLFILNPNYDNVRAQILDPRKRVLPTKGVSWDVSLEPGYYLVKQPIVLKGLLIVFQLRFNNRISNVGVFLNHPDTIDINFYTLLKGKEKMKMSIEKEDFKELDFLTSKQNIQLYYDAIKKPYEIDLKRIGLDFLT